MDAVTSVMYRRGLLLCGMTSLLAALAFSAVAQTATKLPRVVMILGGTETSAGPFAESFLEGMRQAGQIPGRTVQIDLRYAEFAAVRPLINEVVAESPAMLVVGGLSAARYARDATTTVPVVVATSSDLADAGIVQSLARPGGNITGISDLTDEITVKRLELLKAALPSASRVVLLVNPEFPATLIATDALAVQLAAELIKRATALGIPVVHFWPGTAEQGAFLSYQADVHDNFRRAAGYVDKILRGTKPSDLPIYQSARYELVVNAKVARTLGLTLPPSFLARADRVIQ